MAPRLPAFLCQLSCFHGLILMFPVSIPSAHSPTTVSYCPHIDLLEIGTVAHLWNAVFWLAATLDAHYSFPFES